MRSFTFIVLCFSLIFLLMYQFFEHPQLRYNSLNDRITHPLDHRLRYRIGHVDPRFGLKPEQVKQLAFEATQIWEQQTQKSYFVYDPEAQLTIHLIYDQRQQESTARRQKMQEIDQNQQLWTQKQDELNQENEDLALMFKQIEQQKLNIEHNPDNIYLEDQDLKIKIQEFNQRVTAFNQRVGELNQMNLALDDSIQNFNQQFQPRLFDKGIFNGKEIVIYEFHSSEDLRLTLAHEFGHALGLSHHQDPEGLMYPMMQKQKQHNFQLSAADLLLLMSR